MAELGTQIPAAMTAQNWDRASDLLEQLELHAPDHPQADAWNAEVGEQLAIRGLIDSYRRTQEALDASGYRALWLSLDDGDFSKIQRSYGDMRSQQISIDGIDVDHTGSTAEVRFRESRTFDLKAGGKHSTEAKTVLSLRRVADGGWRIAARTVER